MSDPHIPTSQPLHIATSPIPPGPSSSKPVPPSATKTSSVFESPAALKASTVSPPSIAEPAGSIDQRLSSGPSASKLVEALEDVEMADSVAPAKAKRSWRRRREMGSDSEEDLDPNREYEVEKVIAKRYNREGEFEYHVKWVGYKKMSWEPSALFSEDNEPLAKFLRKENRREARCDPSFHPSRAIKPARSTGRPKPRPSASKPEPITPQAEPRPRPVIRRATPFTPYPIGIPGYYAACRKMFHATGDNKGIPTDLLDEKYDLWKAQLCKDLDAESKRQREVCGNPDCRIVAYRFNLWNPSHKSAQILKAWEEEMKTVERVPQIMGEDQTTKKKKTSGEVTIRFNVNRTRKMRQKRRQSCPRRGLKNKKNIVVRYAVKEALKRKRRIERDDDLREETPMETGEVFSIWSMDAPSPDFEFDCSMPSSSEALAPHQQDFQKMTSESDGTSSGLLVPVESVRSSEAIPALQDKAVLTNSALLESSEVLQPPPLVEILEKTKSPKSDGPEVIQPAESSFVPFTDHDSSDLKESPRPSKDQNPSLHGLSEVHPSTPTPAPPALPDSVLLESSEDLQPPPPPAEKTVLERTKSPKLDCPKAHQNSDVSLVSVPSTFHDSTDLKESTLHQATPSVPLKSQSPPLHGSSEVHPSTPTPAPPALLVPTVTSLNHVSTDLKESIRPSTDQNPPLHGSSEVFQPPPPAQVLERTKRPKSDGPEVHQPADASLVSVRTTDHDLTDLKGSTRLSKDHGHGSSEVLQPPPPPSQVLEKTKSPKSDGPEVHQHADASLVSVRTTDHDSTDLKESTRLQATPPVPLKDHEMSRVPLSTPAPTAPYVPTVPSLDHSSSEHKESRRLQTPHDESPTVVQTPSTVSFNDRDLSLNGSSGVQAAPVVQQECPPPASPAQGTNTSMDHSLLQTPSLVSDKLQNGSQSLQTSASPEDQGKSLPGSPEGLPATPPPPAAHQVGTSSLSSVNQSGQRFTLPEKKTLPPAPAPPAQQTTTKQASPPGPSDHNESPRLQEPSMNPDKLQEGSPSIQTPPSVSSKDQRPSVHQSSECLPSPPPPLAGQQVGTSPKSPNLQTSSSVSREDNRQTLPGCSDVLPPVSLPSTALQSMDSVQREGSSTVPESSSGAKTPSINGSSGVLSPAPQTSATPTSPSLHAGSPTLPTPSAVLSMDLSSADPTPRTQQSPPIKEDTMEELLARHRQEMEQLMKRLSEKQREDAAAAQPPAVSDHSTEEPAQKQRKTPRPAIDEEPEKGMRIYMDKDGNKFVAPVRMIAPGRKRDHESGKSLDQDQGDFSDGEGPSEPVRKKAKKDVAGPSEPKKRGRKKADPREFFDNMWVKANQCVAEKRFEEIAELIKEIPIHVPLDNGETLVNFVATLNPTPLALVEALCRKGALPMIPDPPSTKTRFNGLRKRLETILANHLPEKFPRMEIRNEEQRPLFYTMTGLKLKHFPTRQSLDFEVLEIKEGCQFAVIVLPCIFQQFGHRPSKTSPAMSIRVNEKSWEVAEDSLSYYPITPRLGQNRVEISMKMDSSYMIIYPVWYVEREPVVEPAMEQVEEPVVEPIIEQVVEAVMEQIGEPIPEQVGEPVMEPVMEQVMEPVMNQAMEPALAQVVEPVLEPVLEQVIEPVMEQVVGPVMKVAHELEMVAVEEEHNDVPMDVDNANDAPARQPVRSHEVIVLGDSDFEYEDDDIVVIERKDDVVIAR